ncbi:hypothetical protein B0H66DRAFT_381653 [Apodospora peruviana]|uniref:NmrA-like domain-containing protein n=1 Tax=Apodospora peruviana TaxID=516989 RepID=A0AAE0HTZ1_9PEZI|nr:hypothetical protein B0H66DRAFT_381653 [Apodospora peruviana]
MATRNILVVGATGKQGGAVVKALLGLPKSNPPIHILALTRDASSARAKALADSSNGLVEPIQGDATNPKPIFDSKPKRSIHELFLVTTPGKATEESQAIPFIDAAAEHGVKHIVFSSVDRGGDARSWENPTDIPHFLAKHNIELYLRDKAAKSKFTWTILRPTAFLDNFSPGFFGSMFPAMWYKSLSPDTKLQLVSTNDIGVFAAKALTEPTDKWAGKAVSLAGDEITLAEAKDKFKKVVGKELPQTFTVLGAALLWGVKELGTMFSFFEKEGYGADITALKKEVPVQDFETWLRECSKWKDQIQK